MRSTIQPTGRAPALHTSFEEHRASLTERKNYRRWTKKKKVDCRRERYKSKVHFMFMFDVRYGTIL